MSSEFTVNLKVIGTVKNGFTDISRQEWAEVVSEVVVDDSFAEALDGLEEFSHIIILFWMHQIPASFQPKAKIHPRDRQELPLTGLFATRTQYRPNPIGKTTVKLVKRLGNTLTVKGLDAIDGTPVIDIKPYVPGYDSVDEAKLPAWTNRERRRSC